MARRFLAAASCLLLVLAVTANAPAAVMTYPGGMGETTRFGLIEESSTSLNFPLYGEPTIAGDMLVFSPATFESSSENGDADITDGRLSLMVWAKPGFKITGVWVEEFGDYTLVGDSLAGVGSVAFVSGDGGGAPAVEGVSFSDDESLDIATPFTLSYGVDVEASEKISIVLDNTLVTTAGEVSAGFIKKKGFKLTIHTIPEPGTLVLFGCAGLGLAAVAWRRRR